ncbi:MAG TPA: ABC transporter ATP-binding protein [Fibrobacteria bacterium]|nr:ABC transporter ATP-binding protein [Fibrobacteria bacterium]
MVEAVVETKALRKSYFLGKEEVPVLHGLDFVMPKGQYGAIMGPSGSGKSTLLNILGCLDRPTGGECFIAGRDTAKLSENELAELRCREIGFVFQAFNLLPRLTLEQNIELPLQYLGLPKKQRRKMTAEAMERLGLGERGRHLPAEVSGGQKQRAAIARALVKRPALLLADEPTGNLDSTTTEEVLQIFDELNREGNTILVITHESDVAKRARLEWHIRDGNISTIRGV